jgi:8-amino-7-oxononanoate synthase
VPSALLPSAQERLLEALAVELAALEAEQLRRRPVTLEAVEGARVRIDGRILVNWCSNDYLGLSLHPALAAAAAEAAAAWGVGARAARLLSGTSRWHARLEAALASWFGTEAALVYASGYLANLGTLGALLTPRDAIVIDRAAHASLFDAVRASRAAVRVFRHQDATHAEDLLARLRGRRRLIVTEGVFSMEGDRAPLPALLEVGRRQDATVYVDDAHGAFVLGDSGRGAPEAAGIPHDAFIYMGTLGKALGCQGGFVTGPAGLIEFLQNRARTFIYETAPAVPVVAAAVAALEVLAGEPGRRVRLQANARRLREQLSALGPGPQGDASHIVPVVVGSAGRALAAASALWDRGCWAPAIRPPTVPEGAARLRLSVTALHTDAEIDALAGALREVLA